MRTAGLPEVDPPSFRWEQGHDDGVPVGQPADQNWSTVVFWQSRSHTSFARSDAWITLGAADSVAFAAVVEALLVRACASSLIAGAGMVTGAAIASGVGVVTAAAAVVATGALSGWRSAGAASEELQADEALASAATRVTSRFLGIRFIRTSSLPDGDFATGGRAAIVDSLGYGTRSVPPRGLTTLPGTGSVM